MTDMKSFKMRLTYSALALGLLPMLAACAGDNPAPPEEVKTPTIVSFTVSLDNPNEAREGSRADDDWDGPYPDDDGYDFDNYLNPTTFYPVLYAVNADGSLSRFVDIKPLNLIGPEYSSDNSKTTFSFTGMIEVEVGRTDFATLAGSSQKYRLMIYANEFYAQGTVLNEKLQFAHIGNQGKPGFYSVPMWGVTEFTFQNLKQGETLILNEIPLLRSMAMIRVQLKDPKAPGSNEPQDVDLMGLKFSRYNSDGLVAPGNWNLLSTTANLKFKDTPNYLASPSADYTILVGDPKTVNDPATDDEEMPWMQIDADGAEVYHHNATVTKDMICFYLPEVENDNDNQLVLEVTYRINHGDEKGEPRTYPLYLCRYENGYPITPTRQPMVPVDNTDMGLWNVVRNHIYEYTITGVQDAKITIEARVKDWQYHKSTTDLE